MERWHDTRYSQGMMHVTMTIISKAVLGSDIKSEGDEVGDSLLTCMEYFNRLRMPFGELFERIPILPINKGIRVQRKD